MSVSRSIEDYVKVYPGILPQDFCAHLISKFNLCTQEHFDDSVKKFSQINLVSNKELMSTEISILGKAFVSIVKRYVEELQITHFPAQYAFEEFRIKRYQSTDYFDDHVDVTDYPSAKRFLSIFCYLNVNSGTDFYFKTINPSMTGTIVVFPPTWMFPHKGISPTTGEKYFLGTYLHYI